MRALTYIFKLPLKDNLLWTRGAYGKAMKAVVSECTLLFISSIIIALAFTPSRSEASSLDAITHGQLLLQNNKQADFLNSPLVNTDVDITITGTIARVKVSQEFLNPSQEWVNGKYVFPLPENAAVDHLTLRVGVREFEGQIHPKKKAKKIFNQAKARGKKASLIEQDRPNLFTNSIANIGPDEKVEVIIEYQQFVHYDQGEFSLRFPSTFTPRYISPDLTQLIKNKNSSFDIEAFEKNVTAFVEDTIRVSPPLKKQGNPENRLDIRVDLDAGFPIASMSSESHDIRLSPITEHRFELTLKNPERADRDFLLSWRRADESQPVISHFTQFYQGEEYGLMMFIPPTEAKNKARVIQREVTFVLDISGSMQGTSIEQAKSALILGMENLSSEDTFNLIVFNSHAQSYWRYPQKATAENIIEARQFVRQLRADGGTEIAAALRLALKSNQNGSLIEESPLKQVIFITDGSVGNEDYLMQFIDQNLQDRRLFTIGIGSAPNTYFMSEAARSGKGSFTYINDINHVGQKMQALFNQINHPVLSDIQMNFPANIEAYPENIPDLYTGQPLLISYKGSTWGDPIEAKGHLTKANWSTTFPPAMLNTAMRRYQREPSGLNVLWARNKIDQLTVQRRKEKEREKFNQAIEETAMTHHIVSEFTSLVAVDVTLSRPSDILSNDRTVPNHLPAGMVQRQTIGTLPQTATSALLKLIIGLFILLISLCIHLFTHRK